ncbi:hypothetical protein BDK51DRAFT_41717 [Blyttiomyces helicus]|uniref:Uncharacterized protein n=1 Tax=Blyttiomyces helicus TaxID=388810 RepID=A0A4P9W989_9FUNG|nr:hypothetical protein BDK51DRAFT_41717 [Blyttiomyces helicus]|eukprot:RKO88722.1 hypothetical protein BDK51DRAFT_41717 [Blyttiomyces helicus]
MGTTKPLGGTTMVASCPANAAVTVSVLSLAPRPPTAKDKSQNGHEHHQATRRNRGVLVCALLHGANGCPQVDAAMGHPAQARVSVLVSHLVLYSGGWQWQSEGNEPSAHASVLLDKRVPFFAENQCAGCCVLDFIMHLRMATWSGGLLSVQVVFEVHAGEFVEGNEVVSKFLSVSAVSSVLSQALTTTSGISRPSVSGILGPLPTATELRATDAEVPDIN